MNADCSLAIGYSVNRHLEAGAFIHAAEHDSQLVQLLRRVDSFGFTFICYPLGGKARSEWTPSSSGRSPSMPVISLTDKQHNGQFFNRICGRISDWIDVDSADLSVRTLSQIALEEELAYARYLSIRAILLKLHHRDSPTLASIISTNVWFRASFYRVWFELPTNSVDLDIGENLLHYHFFYRVDIHSKRPIACLLLVLLDPCTIANPFSKCLAPSHQHLVVALCKISSRPQVVISARLNNDNDLPAQLGACLQFVSPLLLDADDKQFDDVISEYNDALQTPLQPLSDNLDSNTYQVFEKDPVKYDLYERAILLAAKKLIKDQLIDDDNILSVLILGAGRGPLVSSAIRAETQLALSIPGVRFELTAVEKNDGAMITLYHVNRTEWDSRVHLVHGDMRNADWVLQRTPDIVVSELLGSFGDNELAPECLDGVTNRLKKSTVCIPQQYTSYMAPMQSFKLRNSIWEYLPSRWTLMARKKSTPNCSLKGDQLWQQFRQFDPNDNFDQPYVVRLTDHFLASEPKPVFTFKHPNSTQTSNERDRKISFTVDQHCEIMGLAGYFHAILYQDITLNIVPSCHSPALISWFPALFPLRKSIRLNQGDSLQVSLSRIVDEAGVWYEWNVAYQGIDGQPVISDTQNLGGSTFYMSLDGQKLPSSSK